MRAEKMFCIGPLGIEYTPRTHSESSTGTLESEDDIFFRPKKNTESVDETWNFASWKYLKLKILPVMHKNAPQIATPLHH